MRISDWSSDVCSSNLTFDDRFVWMRQKRIQGSHFANLLQASQANQLVIERRLDPCMSEVFFWADIPTAHTKMCKNQQKPGNMARLVNAKVTGHDWMSIVAGKGRGGSVITGR